MKKKRLSSFEREILSQDEKLIITFVMRVSHKYCQNCQCSEYGRIFQIVGIKDILRLEDCDSDYSQKVRRMRKDVMGKNLCLDCLP